MHALSCFGKGYCAGRSINLVRWFRNTSPSICVLSDEGACFVKISSLSFSRLFLAAAIVRDFTMQTLVLEGFHFLSFFAMFSVIYFTGYCLLFRNWNPKHRPDATSCLISLFHGTPAVFLALSALLSNPSSGFSSKNFKSHNLALDFSIAYFTVDLLHYLVLLPGDVLFIAHHVATLFVFCTCRYLVSHGAFAIMVLLVLAEVTSASQNIWTLAGLKRSELAVAANVYRILSLPFYVVYSIMRVILGPLFFLKMSIYYLSGEADDVIPRWVSVSWIVVVGGAILVSIMWISNLWLELVREKKGIGNKKLR